ncbi:MAG: hypothetical protein QME96_19140 [Myxococcota bacterium]|nr:hypothetical protein [Myxococcota bacterium]
MEGDSRKPGASADSEDKGKKLRPASFFRALALSALASVAPAAGCYQSEPDSDVADAADATDRGADEADGRSDATDVAADDAQPEVMPPYGAPEYGAPVYGI